MTFMVGKDGVVYQKDLGEKTGELATSMTEWNLADGWSTAVPHGNASRASNKAKPRLEALREGVILTR
jgi:hypothetical protein